MAVIRKYVVQIVIMMEEEPGQWVKDQARFYGVSEAQIARDAIALGRDRLSTHYAKMGIRPCGLPDKRDASRRARKGPIPEATFVTPASV